MVSTNMNQEDFRKDIQSKVVIGSRAYGLHTESSDYDRRGFYLAPIESLFHLTESVPEQLQFRISENDHEVYWEFQKYLKLLLQANPTVLETIYTPLVEYTTPLHEVLRENRARFISCRSYKTFKGYARQQLLKAQADEREKGKPDWGNLMHMVRLLEVCRILFITGEPDLDASPLRETLLAIKAGDVPMNEILDFTASLNRAIDSAYEFTKVPTEPDTEWVEKLYQDTRYQQLSDLTISALTGPLNT